MVVNQRAPRHAPRAAGATRIIPTPARPQHRAGGSWRRSLRPRVEPLEGRSLLTAGALSLSYAEGGGVTSPVGLTPAQVAHAYGFDNIDFKGGITGDGSGQTI